MLLPPILRTWPRGDDINRWSIFLWLFLPSKFTFAEAGACSSYLFFSHSMFNFRCWVPFQYIIIYQWPFQEPKLEVPTIYKAYFSGLCKGMSPQNMALYMVQYLHFRILKFPLNIFNFWYCDTLRGYTNQTLWSALFSSTLGVCSRAISAALQAFRAMQLESTLFGAFDIEVERIPKPGWLTQRQTKYCNKST